MIFTLKLYNGDIPHDFTDVEISWGLPPTLYMVKLEKDLLFS